MNQGLHDPGLHDPGYMTRARYYAVAAFSAVAAAPFTPSLLAQAPQFRPVTDAMLANPDSRRLADDQPHVRPAPLQHARSDQQEQRLAAAHGWTRRPAGRATQADDAGCA